MIRHMDKLIEDVKFWEESRVNSFPNLVTVYSIKSNGICAICLQNPQWAKACSNESNEMTVFCSLCDHIVH
jgi:hypothetical protein